MAGNRFVNFWGVQNNDNIRKAQIIFGVLLVVVFRSSKVHTPGYQVPSASRPVSVPVHISEHSPFLSSFPEFSVDPSFPGPSHDMTLTMKLGQGLLPRLVRCMAVGASREVGLDRSTTRPLRVSIEGNIASGNCRSPRSPVFRLFTFSLPSHS